MPDFAVNQHRVPADQGFGIVMVVNNAQTFDFVFGHVEKKSESTGVANQDG